MSEQTFEDFSSYLQTAQTANILLRRWEFLSKRFMAIHQRLCCFRAMWRLLFLHSRLLWRC